VRRRREVEGEEGGWVFGRRGIEGGESRLKRRRRRWRDRIRIGCRCRRFERVGLGRVGSKERRWFGREERERCPGKEGRKSKLAADRESISEDLLLLVRDEEVEKGEGKKVRLRVSLRKKHMLDRMRSGWEKEGE